MVSMVRHVYYIPASYAALLYSLIAASGLFLCLYVGVIAHPKEMLTTGCEVYEFWPSISTAIGDMQPERQIWRIAFILCTPFRLATTISLFYVFWVKGSRGMTELYSARGSPRKLLGSTAFITIAMLWCDLWRLIGAVLWTMASSSESLSYHNVGFVPYVALGFLLQVFLCILVRRSANNLQIYGCQRDAAMSYKLKKLFMYLQTAGAMGVIVFFTRHRLTCAPGAYSLSTMAEWLFGMANILFDATAWYDLRGEGWWLSSSPSFYRHLWGEMRQQVLLQATVMRAPGTAPAAEENGEKDATATPAVEMVAGAVDAKSMMPGTVAARRSGTTSRVDAAGGATTVLDMSAVGVDADTSEDSGMLLSSRYPDDGEAAAANGRLLFAEPGATPRAGQFTMPPQLGTGEYFLSSNIILHRFTFCCAPSRLSMWLCDIYFAAFFFESIVHLVEHLYFMPLVAMSISWHVVLLVVLGSPLLLRFKSTRQWTLGPAPMARTLLKPSHPPIGGSHRVVPNYIFFYFIFSLSHLQQLITNDAGTKILGAAVGPCFLLLGTYARLLYPSTAMLRSTTVESNEVSRRLLYAFPMGMVLNMLLRILYVSVSPFYVDPTYGGVFGIGLGLGFTTIMYRHAMFGDVIAATSGRKRGLDAATASGAGAAGADEEVSGEDNSAAPSAATPNGGPRRVQFAPSQSDESQPNTITALATSYPPPSPKVLGVLFGLTLAVLLNMFHSANIIPRLVAVDPFPASLVVTTVFVAGVYFSPDVIAIAPSMMRPKRGGASLLNPRRVLGLVFRHSTTRVTLFTMAGLVLLLFGTRQTNFSFELRHKGYPTTESTPEDQVKIDQWDVQEHFSGSKHLAFLGGLMFTFGFAALLPVIMEITWAHQRARRLAALADVIDANSVYKRECGAFASFENLSIVCTLCISTLNVFCLSYPFIPLGWIFRERNRTVVMANVGAVLFFTHLIVRRIRQHASGAGSSAAATSSSAARKQRSLQLGVIFLLGVAFFFVICGRVSLRPEDRSYPEGKTSALQYQTEVLRLHEMLLDIQREQNGATDPLLAEPSKNFYIENAQYKWDEMEKNISTAMKAESIDPKYGLGHIADRQTRLDVWDAAKAMSEFRGLIWTVHFALDNYGVDSLYRMVHHIKEVGAGIVGILESDAMHLTNGNRDITEFLSYHLGFKYADYGPTVIDNTYGCTVISRYPLYNIRRYVMPSPLGELACVVYAEADIFGLRVNTYVGHFGNTHHFADGLLQSQFLGKQVMQRPGPSMWLGYLVTHPGDKRHYHEYSHPTERGKLRDAGLELYVKHPWKRLADRGGYEEVPPATVTAQPGESVDFNVEFKLPIAAHLEAEVKDIDVSFRRTPEGKAPRYFHYTDTNRYTLDHPRWEFLDRYCQYSMYKTGAAEDELEKFAEAKYLQPYVVSLFDWRRVIKPVDHMSDTEIQVIQLSFKKRE